MLTKQSGLVGLEASSVERLAVHRTRPCGGVRRMVTDQDETTEGDCLHTPLHLEISHTYLQSPIPLIPLLPLLHLPTRLHLLPHYRSHLPTMPLPPPKPGANAIRTVHELDTMIFEKNVDIPLKDGGLCRGNVYKPKAPGRYPVIMTCEFGVPPRRRANQSCMLKRVSSQLGARGRTVPSTRRSIRKRRPIPRLPPCLIRSNPRLSKIRLQRLGDPRTDVLDSTRLRRPPRRREGHRFVSWFPRYHV
jgi:hypothetical protein